MMYRPLLFALLPLLAGCDRAPAPETSVPTQQHQAALPAESAGLHGRSSFSGAASLWVRGPVTLDSPPAPDVEPALAEQPIADAPSEPDSTSYVDREFRPGDTITRQVIDPRPGDVVSRR